MSKIYVGQSNLTISLITGATLENVQAAKIKYKRPDGTQGEWTGTTSGQLVEYSTSNGDLPTAGTWTLWVYIVFNDNRISVGEPSTLVVYAEGQ